MPKKKDKTATKTDKIHRRCRVELQDKEKIELGRLMADSQERVAESEANAKSAAAQYKGEIELAKADFGRACSLVRAGYEERQVECERVFDYVKGEARVTRLDTGEVIEQRPLTEDEKQSEMNLDLSGSAKPQTPASEPTKEEQGLMEKAKAILKETKRASAASLQRKLKVSFTLAQRVMDCLEAAGVVGPPRGSEPREILIDLDAEDGESKEGSDK